MYAARLVSGILAQLSFHFLFLRLLFDRYWFLRAKPALVDPLQQQHIYRLYGFLLGMGEFMHDELPAQHRERWRRSRQARFSRCSIKRINMVLCGSPPDTFRMLGSQSKSPEEHGTYWPPIAIQKLRLSTAANNRTPSTVRAANSNPGST